MIVTVGLIILVLVFAATALIGAPYVPSLNNNLEQALTELYPISKKDLLVDIGSGDGVVLRKASSFGARAVGFEINPVLVLVSLFLSRHDKRVKVNFANHWRSHLPIGTTVVYIFSVDRDIKKFAKWLQSESNILQQPIRLISLGFDIAGKKPIKQKGAYYLYLFKPLQSDEAQV